MDAVLNRIDSSLRKDFEENGYILLGWPEAGFLYLLSTVPVSSVADLKKAKVWIWEDSPMSKAIFDEAGVSAIPLSVPDVLVGLQTGLVQVIYVPPTGAISLQWFTKVKNMTDVPLDYLTGGLVVNKDTFRKISANDQKVVLEAFQHHMDQLRTVTRNENRDAIQVMTKQGVKIVTSSKEHIEEFKKLSVPMSHYPNLRVSRRKRRRPRRRLKLKSIRRFARSRWSEARTFLRASQEPLPPRG